MVAILNSFSNLYETYETRIIAEKSDAKKRFHSKP